MIPFLIVTVYLLHCSVFCHMFPNERTSLYDCELRYYQVSNPGFDVIAFGMSTQIREYPHMAAIGWTKPNDTILWLCGGSLIWDNFVLTAAHCVKNRLHGVPDVVRLGDIDLYSSDDDEWAQQFRIVEIVRHPEHNFTAWYHDIALLKLDRNVVENGPVIPACLWKEEEVRFKKLVATGWGRTGDGAAPSPKLLQISQKPISIEECSKTYYPHLYLRQGLQAQQLCAQDEKMDTCEGDSGGPLQVKLLHNARMTPFIVAVTSFGAKCGVSNPGVYTRVSAYYKWIIDTMRQHGAIGLEENYNETLCALRYITYREYEKGFGSTSDGKFYQLNFDNLQILSRSVPYQLAQIRWNGPGPDCYGVIVDEDTVLTVADCTSFEGNSPSLISYLENKFASISKIMVHPKHVRGSAYNNIAILKLRDMLDLPEYFVPSCISRSKYINEFLIGYGRSRKDINEVVYYGNKKALDPQLIDLELTLKYQNRSTCKTPALSDARLKRGLAREHLCVGNDVFLVPGSCKQLTGSMIGYSSNFYHYTYALSLLSRDCGFGEHLIGTRLEKHIKWMKKVLLPCSNPINDVGVIKSDALHSDILNCSNLVQKFTVGNSNGSLANIGSVSNNTTHFRCLGSIVSRSFVLTTASCLGESLPNIVQLIESRIQINIESIIKHPGFNATDRTNDIALVKLEKPLSWDSSIYPICLWMNQTHTPIILDINYIAPSHRVDLFDKDSNHAGYVYTSKKLHPMYNSDCQKVHPYLLKGSQLCTRSSYHCALGVAPSDQLIWKDDQTEVMYLVGLSTNSCDQYKWKYNVFTRISAFTEWISENAYFD